MRRLRCLGLVALFFDQVPKIVQQAVDLLLALSGLERGHQKVKAMTGSGRASRASATMRNGFGPCE